MKAFCCKKSSRSIRVTSSVSWSLRTQGVLTYQLDDLVELVLLLQQVHGVVTVLHERLSQMLIEPRAQGVQIQGVGVQPVDGREVPPVGQRRIQRPEHLHDTHGTLSYRFAEVAAGRRHGAHRRQAAGTLLAAEALHHTGPLIELGQTAAPDRQGSPPRRASPPDGRTSHAGPRPSGRWSLR